MSGSAQCPHSDLDYDLHLTTMEDSNVSSLRIRAKCNICGKKMKLHRGLAFGANSRVATIDDTEFGGILVPVIAMDEEPSKEYGFCLTRTVIA